MAIKRNKKNKNEMYAEDFSDYMFYFVAGYTDGGAEYGLTKEEMISSSLQFRRALKRDAEEVVKLIHLAIGDIADQLTGETKKENIEKTLTEFFKQQNNRLSYENIVVADIYGNAIGILLAYPGEKGTELDRPILEKLRKKNKNAEITLDKEADAGDFYIDTLAVDPEFQGYGIGSSLLKHAEELAKDQGYSRISLNVDKDNPSAKRLYERLGYKEKKIVIINKQPYDYMVKINNEK